MTEVAIKNAKADAKPLKLFDSGGLFLRVTPTGGKWWRLKYRFNGKEKLLNLVIHPDVPLAARQDKKTDLWIDGARDKRDHGDFKGSCRVNHSRCFPFLSAIDVAFRVEPHHVRHRPVTDRS